MTSILLIIAGVVAGWWLLWRVPVLPTRRRPPDEVQPCAVVIPARNEADNLPLLLGSIARQERPPRELVVVDDGSEDGTAEVAATHGATVIVASPPPPGWTGKSWACQQGADATTAGRLVFVDADVRLAGTALASVLETHDRVGGLVSVAPIHRMESIVERLSTPFNIVAFMGVGAARPGRRGRSSGAFGPCMVCDRTDYDAVGGHQVAARSVTEDLALAAAFDERGIDTFVFGGATEFDYRMYSQGLGALVEGWSKNFASGARFVSPVRALLIGLWITALITTAKLIVDAGFSRTADDMIVAGSAYAVVVLQQRIFSARLSNAGWGTALLFPITTLFFVYVFIRSLWLTLVRRRVQWRGRKIDIGRNASFDRSPGT